MKLLKVKIREQRELLQRVTLWQWNCKENERQKEASLVATGTLPEEKPGIWEGITSEV